MKGLGKSMICNICGTNEATIHLTEIVNNQMIEIHLCEACAQEKGTDFKTHFSFGDILAGLAEPEKAAPGSQAKSVIKCSECKMTYEDFTKSGRLGCANCYQVFSQLLTPLIKRVQRSMLHVGKKPSRAPRDIRATHDLRLLQERLNQCIESEKFEEAARVRDEIRQILEKVKKGKKKT